MSLPDPTQEEMEATAHLLPSDLASKVTTWPPVIQEVVIAGVTVFIQGLEQEGKVLDPVEFEQVITYVTLYLHMRALINVKRWEAGER